MLRILAIKGPQQTRADLKAMAGEEEEGAGKVWLCVCSFPTMNRIPIVLESVFSSLGRTVAPLSRRLSESMLLEVPGRHWWQTSVILAL